MGIGLNCRKILLTMALVKVTSLSFAQMYTPPKACVSDMTTGTNGTPEGCAEPAYFFDRDPSSVVRSWDFGGLSTFNGQTGVRNASFQFPSAGVFKVTLTKVNAAGGISTEFADITVGTFPEQPKFNKKISADTTICDGSTLKLDPYKGLGGGGGNDVEYLWFPGGETTPTIDVDTSGCYSVEVFNKLTKCSRTAKINVKFCLQEAPAGGGSEKWHFGNGAVLDFQYDATEIPRDSLNPDGSVFVDPETEDPSYSPLQSTETHPMNVNEGTAMVYGPSGALVFYSDGKTVYSGQDDSVIGTIPGASNSTSQGVSIIPKGSCNECPHHQYYMFSVDPATKLLSYSILDMRYNGKKGALTETNIPVMYSPSDRITAFQNSAETGFVIVAHESGTNNFSLINVDSTGLNFTKVPIGAIQNTPESRNGYAAINPGKSKLAQGLVEGGNNYVEVFDLADDNLTGYMKINLGIPAPPQVYGVTFSPNGDILYVTLNGGGDSYIVQLPLFLGNVAAIEGGKQIISKSSTQEYGAIQMGPVNGTGSKYVYIALNNEDKVLYIQSPDVSGNAAAVGFSTSNGVELAGTSKLGFPNVSAATPIQDGQGLSATYSGNCFRYPTVLHTDGACDPMRNKVFWEFEDGSTQEGKDVSYTFPKTGWNKINVRIKIFNKSPLEGIINSQFINQLLETECIERTFKDSIYIKPSPQINMPDSIYVCVVEGESVLIDPVMTVDPDIDEDPFTYEWTTSVGSFLSSDSTYSIDVPAVFKLKVTNKFECFAKDEIKSIEGCEPRIFLPDAMTPNDDGVNDNLDVFHAHITDFRMNIYNRWGELIFTSDNPDIKWDGKARGKIFAPMVYPYTIDYKSFYFPERGILTKKGAITVLR